MPLSRTYWRALPSFWIPAFAGMTISGESPRDLLTPSNTFNCNPAFRANHDCSAAPLPLNTIYYWRVSIVPARSQKGCFVDPVIPAKAGIQNDGSARQYVRDSGIVHALLGLARLEDVLGHPVAGASWEGFVIEQLLAAAPHAEASFYRTSHGAEADLVLGFRNGENWVVEIKRSSAPVVSKGFHLAAADVGAVRKIVLAPVTAAYPMRDGIEVMDLLTAVSAVARN